MKILLVADGRSPITRNWIRMMAELPDDYEIALASTFPCEPLPDIHEQTIIPVAFSQAAGSQAGHSKNKDSLMPVIRRARRQLRLIRSFLGPSTLPGAGKKLSAFINSVRPDVVHALRIPYEGMLASHTPPSIPLIVSTWGNDLTLHAYESGAMQYWTRHTLQRCNGLLADARRDIRLAEQWGYDSKKPTLVVPGSGGIDLDEMTRTAAAADIHGLMSESGPHIINPRGLRPGYVNTQGFFEAAALVHKELPEVTFLCPGMQGQEEAQSYMHRYHLKKSVRLLPYLSQGQIWKLFQACEVTASISTHDGTPNTLLEAMACGCFPVAGELESLYPWIQSGENGFLVNPLDPHAIAASLLSALRQPELRRKAAVINRSKIEQQAGRRQTSEQMLNFYQHFKTSSDSQQTADVHSSSHDHLIRRNP